MGIFLRRCIQKEKEGFFMSFESSSGGGFIGLTQDAMILMAI